MSIYTMTKKAGKWMLKVVGTDDMKEDVKKGISTVKEKIKKIGEEEVKK